MMGAKFSAKSFQPNVWSLRAASTCPSFIDCLNDFFDFGQRFGQRWAESDQFGNRVTQCLGHGLQEILGGTKVSNVNNAMLVPRVTPGLFAGQLSTPDLNSLPDEFDC
jgi:hypothetical protein